MAKKKTAPTGTDALPRRTVKVMGVATTEAEIQDSISRSERDESGTVTVPGKLTDWLNPRTKGKPVLDPVFLAQKEGGKKRKKKGDDRPTELPPAGGDGLPRPGRR